MTELGPRIEAALTDFVPAEEVADGWSAIVRDAGLTGRSLRRPHLALAAIVAAACVAAVAILAWPFGGAERVSVLDRALAAVGDGPVLHVVLEEGQYTLVNLRTGAERVVRRERELWVDPERGFHYVERFEGVVQAEYVLPPGDHADEASRPFADFARGYREALESGRAEVREEDVVDGTPVVWLEVASNRIENEGMPPEIYRMEVAVSKETYEPLYLRYSRNGKPVSRPWWARIVEAEALPAGAGEFSGPPLDEDGTGWSRGGGPTISVARASEILGTPVAWAPRVLDLPLAQVRPDVIEVEPGRKASRTFRGVSLFFGSVREPSQSGGGDPQPAMRRRHVLMTEFRLGSWARVDLVALGIRRYVPPAGTLLLIRGSGAKGLVRIGRVAVLIEAPNRDYVLAAARALRPYRGGR